MVAVPSAVAKLTVTPMLGTADKLTVKTAFVVPILPSITVTSLMDKVGELGGVGSLSKIVQMPLPREIEAGKGAVVVGLLRVTVKVSVPSNTTSSTIGIETVIVAGDGPARKVSVPLDCA